MTQNNKQKVEYYRKAAEFFMKIAWASERSDKLPEALDAYRNASHRYYWADAMEESAYAARDAAELSHKLGKTEDAAELLELAAERLHVAEQQTTRDKGDADILRDIQANWHRKAAYHYKELGTQEDKTHALSAFSSAIGSALSGQTPELEQVLDDYREAIELAQTLGRYKDLDQLIYSFHAIRRREASEDGRQLFVIFSQINDWIWGYGIKPLRLCRIVALTILAFALFYFLFNETQIGSNSIKQAKSPGWYLFLCIGYSLYSLLPTGVIEWLSGAGLIVKFNVVGVSKWLSAIEVVIGMIYFAMAASLIQRALRRMSHVRSE
jgi:tetratricopeptide (TPR) repeat protein